MIAWQQGTCLRCCTKITWNKIFLWGRERREEWKIFENHVKIFENHDAVQKQRKYGLPSIIFSILWFIFNAMEFTLYFRAVISYQSLFSVRCCFQIFPALQLQIIYLFEIIHHVFEFIIAQHHYVIIGYFWFLILSYGIYHRPLLTVHINQ